MNRTSLNQGGVWISHLLRRMLRAGLNICAVLGEVCSTIGVRVSIGVRISLDRGYVWSVHHRGRMLCAGRFFLDGSNGAPSVMLCF